MKQFTSEQIQDTFEKLPKELQDAITSADINDAIVAIGNKRGLRVDQIGELIDAVGLVMLGLTPSKTFVNNFMQESGVDGKMAAMIAQDINNEVFSKIKTSMQIVENRLESSATQDQANLDLSALERAGGFSIEKPEDDGNGNGVKPMDRAKILSSVENPVPAKETFSQKEPETYAEPLVDHLLANAAATPEHKVIQAPENLPTIEPVETKKTIQNIPKPPPSVPPKPKGPDFYREPIK